MMKADIQKKPRRGGEKQEVLMSTARTNRALEI